MEDTLWDGKSSLTEAIVTGPSWAILFYGRQSLGEGLSLGKVCDAMFMLTGDISWIVKQAQLDANTVTLQEGWQIIGHAIAEWCVEARGPIHPHTHPSAVPPFSFSGQTGPPPEMRLPSADEHAAKPRHTHWTPPWLRVKTSMRLGLWPDEMRPMGHSAHLTLTRPWVWEWPKISINFLLSVIQIW